VISGVFATLRRYAKPLGLLLLGVSAVLGALFTVYATVAYLLTQGIVQDLHNRDDDRLTGNQNATLGILIVIGLLLLLLCSAVISLVANTSSTALLRHAVLGRPVTAGQLWAQSRPYLGRLLATQLLLGLVALVAVLVALLPGALVGLLTGSGAAFGVLAVVLLLVVLGLGCYASVRLTLLVPVLVLEDQRPVAAIRRAWALNQGAWLRSLGIPYVVRVIGSFATQIILMPIGLIASVLLTATATGPTDQYGTTSTSGPSALAILLFVMVVLLGLGTASTLTAPLGPLTDGLLYVDRRIRREGLAETLAAQAAVPAAPGGAGV
jgi:hypothetical protein